jgi:predicted transcriptional regulator
MERFQLFLSAPLLKKLRALSKRWDMSIAEIIRQAVTEFLARQED